MDTNILETINMTQLGAELQDARKKVGLTQEDAAKILDVSRTTITAIESGQRRIKASELAKLARSYGRSVNDFVRPRPKIEPFHAQFRGPYYRNEEDDRDIAPYIDILEGLCRDYLELEQIMEETLPRRYPPEYPLIGLPTDQAADSVASQERNRLGLGDAPISNLRDILEQEVGIRVFYMRLPTRFSGMYVCTDLIGGCIAVNSVHPEVRRRWTLAHDFAHFLTSRYRPVVSSDFQYQRVPESERFADDFSPRFLMPTAGLIRRYTDMKQRNGKATLGDLCTLAHYYGVSVQALTRRLEELRLVKLGIADVLMRDGFKVGEAMQQLGLTPPPAREDLLPVRFKYLALDALRQERIGEEQFAHLMRVDRIEARRIAQAMGEQMPDISEETLRQSDGAATQK